MVAFLFTFYISVMKQMIQSLNSAKARNYKNWFSTMVVVSNLGTILWSTQIWHFYSLPGRSRVRELSLLEIHDNYKLESKRK